jgi:hypothetical protein
MTEFLGNMYSWFTFIPKITLSNLFEILILTVLIYEVHRDSRAFDLRKRSVALDDDQGSCLYFSHFKGRTGNLIYGLLCISFLLSGILRNKKVCDDIFASELLQRFSKLRLEDNDEGCQYELAHMVDDPGDRI